MKQVRENIDHNLYFNVKKNIEYKCVGFSGIAIPVFLFEMMVNENILK